MNSAIKETQKPIVVVEDDHSVRRLLGQVLELKGYRCLLLETLEELLETCSKNAPSIIVCDAGLPDGDGVKACLELRQRWPGLFVILMSGDIHRADSALSAGFDSVLLKPFSIDELLFVLDRKLKTNQL